MIPAALAAVAAPTAVLGHLLLPLQAVLLPGRPLLLMPLLAAPQRRCRCLVVAALYEPLHGALRLLPCSALALLLAAGRVPA